MTLNKRKQQGATLVAWLMGAGLGILIASAVVKVAPYYLEFNNVKGLMTNIASEPGIKNASIRQINAKVEKHLNVNNLYALEEAYYASKNKSRAGGQKVKNPFSITKLRKGKNRRVLTVAYDVPEPWIANLNFLIKFKHSVVLGEPDVVIETKLEDTKVRRKAPKINLN